MSVSLRTLIVTTIVALTACSGGGSTNSATPRTSWLANLRYEPTVLQLSIAGANMAYMYVDAGATNGVYPSPDAFRAQIESANPGLLTGSCAAIARMSASVMQFTDAHGVQAPSYVVFFQPTASGTCSQPIDLGAEGVHGFSVTVTP